MSISREGLDLLKRFEGFRPSAVPIAGGRYLIGYGHTHFARAGARVSEDQAELLLRHDLMPIVAELNTRIYAPLSQNQFDALAMFAFNVGLDAFRDSQISAHLNAGEPLAAARQMAQWRTALIDGKPVVIDALVRRRAAEQDLFMRTTHEVRPASSNLVTPVRDNAGAAAPLPVTQEPAQRAIAPNAPYEDLDQTNPVVHAPAEPPKPPSTLRTRFYDLLRARRPRTQEPFLQIHTQEITWAGPTILALAGVALAAIGFIGFADLESARQAGQARPASLAQAFAGGAGALACVVTALRLALIKRRRDAESEEAGEE